jgi:hypothetical protein
MQAFIQVSAIDRLVKTKFFIRKDQGTPKVPALAVCLASEVDPL